MSFPEECLKGLPEPPPPPEAYHKVSIHYDPTDLPDVEHKQCRRCGFKWTTDSNVGPTKACPKCLSQDAEVYHTQPHPHNVPQNVRNHMQPG